MIPYPFILIAKNVCLVIIILFSQGMYAQTYCDGSDDEILIQTSLQDGGVCEGDTAFVTTDVTDGSLNPLSTVDSILWQWYIFSGLPGSENPSNVIPPSELLEIAYPPYGTVAQNYNIYDELMDINDCNELLSYVTTPPNKIDLGIKSTAYITCPDGSVLSHGSTADFKLELLPRPSFQLESNIICQGDQTCIIDNTCFADSILINLGNGTTTNDLCLSNLPVGTYDIQLIAFNSCGSFTRFE